MLAVLGLLTGCAAPTLTQDGQLVFTEEEQRGAVVLTANGVQYIDHRARPTKQVRRSAFEEWKPPTGFLLPPDGVLRKRSRPVQIVVAGVTVTLRASDAYVPAWGGEVLLRVDVEAAPSKARRAELRPPRRIVFILDNDEEIALDQLAWLASKLGSRDRVALIDSRGATLALPSVPGTYRSLLEGAAERRWEQRGTAPRRRLGASLALAQRLLARGKGAAQVIVLSDGRSPSRSARTRLRSLPRDWRVELVLPDFGVDELDEMLPIPGPLAVENVTLYLHSAPAPLRVLESSGGELEMDLEMDRLRLGDLVLGEGQSEVLRLAAPSFVAGEELRLFVEVEATPPGSKQSRRSRARLGMRYLEDVEKLARQRHGDVIAFASSLAWVQRLEQAFLGGNVDELGGLRPLVRAQARSLRLLAQDTGDAELALQAEVMKTLLRALDD